MVHMEHKNDLQRPCQLWINLVRLCRYREEHVQEVLAVAQIIAWVYNGLTCRHAMSSCGALLAVHASV